MTVRTDSFVPRADVFRQAFADSSPAELLFFARQCLERGGFDQVLGLAEALKPRFASDPALRLVHAVARFVAGERAEALGLVGALVNERPRDVNALSVLGEMRARSGDPSGAVVAFASVLELFPDYPGAQATLSALLMPGPSYRDVLRSVHAALSPRTYLEIGVAAGATLALATGARTVVGVDPVEAPLKHPLPASARIVREPSAAFFAKRRREDVFGNTPVDLTFIDGLHQFEAALQDFIDAEAWSAPSSTIVLHDCVPIAAVSAERERATRFWVGDTWKAVWALASYRQDLRIRTVLAAPSGLVIVRRLDPGSTLLRERFAAIVADLSSQTYPLGVGEWPPELNVVPNTPAGLAEALGA